MSLELIANAGLGRDDPIIDIGGGASNLIENLQRAGYCRLALLDISSQALNHARDRLGERAGEVEWIEQDVTCFAAPHPYALWHDRAAFHFLTARADRQRYVQALGRALSPDGQVVVATFAPDGPNRCSGLEVVRYDQEKLLAEFGPEFELREHRSELHDTPGGREQRFSWFRLGRTQAKRIKPG